MGSTIATGGRDLSAFVTPAHFPSDASEVAAARPPTPNRPATGNDSDTPKRQQELCRNSKPRVGRSNSKLAHSSRRATYHSQDWAFSQRCAASSCSLYGAAVVHNPLHSIMRFLRAHRWMNGASNTISCLLQTRHLAVNRHRSQFCRHEQTRGE
ncbi:hypothetical protein TRVL_03361 [Trypanosoma vivax]|nr:hypothetical protein TRVL_03361 [Trypanosoma vivax]